MFMYVLQVCGEAGSRAWRGGRSLVSDLQRGSGVVSTARGTWLWQRGSDVQSTNAAGIGRQRRGMGLAMHRLLHSYMPTRSHALPGWRRGCICCSKDKTLFFCVCACVRVRLHVLYVYVEFVN